MRELTPKAKSILEEMYTKLGGRPVDEPKPIKEPEAKPRERGPLTSIEAWWESVEHKLDKLPKESLESIRRDLLNGNMYGAFDDYVKKVEKEHGY